MSKYDPLGHFLAKSRYDEVPMTFAEIERLLGFSLPPKAQKIRAWWSNNPDNNVMTKVWLAAGFETEQVDVEGRKLIFRRSHPGGSEGGGGPLADSESGVPKPRRRHPIFGALKDVTWIAPGTDLTEPADPGWADLIDQPDWGKLP